MTRLLLSDLGAGLAALAWAVLAVDPGDGPISPQLAALCSAYVAGGFGFAALGRWYRGQQKTKRELAEKEAQP